jgi:hypothetical protein
VNIKQFYHYLEDKMTKMKRFFLKAAGISPVKGAGISLALVMAFALMFAMAFAACDTGTSNGGKKSGSVPVSGLRLPPLLVPVSHPINAIIPKASEIPAAFKKNLFFVLILSSNSDKTV